MTTARPPIKRIKTGISKPDLIYLAGLLDGRAPSGAELPVLTESSNRLVALAATYGGWVGDWTTNRLDKQDRPVVKDAWWMTNADKLALYEAVAPFMKLRQGLVHKQIEGLKTLLGSRPLNPRPPRRQQRGGTSNT